MPMADDLYDLEEEVREPRRGGGLFLWTVFIMLLIGAAFACWLGSFYIFGHPEQARCYRILKKLKKLDPPRRFDVTAAPQGEFNSSQRLFERYSPLKELELQKENAELLRIYIKNYSESKRVLPYLRGKFEVMETVELTPSDMFQTGVVSLLAPQDYPQVVIEHLFPTSPANVEQAKRVLTPGVGKVVEKTADVTTVIHVERMANGRMLVTVVPLHYPVEGVRGGVGTFPLEPPTDLNIEASLPVIKGKRLDDVLKRWAERKAGEPVVEPGVTPDKPAPLGPEVVRVDTPITPGTKIPETGALQEPLVARAEPVRPVAPTPRPRPGVGDLALNNNNTRPGYRATPLPFPGSSAGPRVAEAVPRPTPAPQPLAAVPPTAGAIDPSPPPPTVPAVGTSPAGVPLKPFVQSNSGVTPPAEAGGTWRTYSPGTQPRGRTIAPSDAASLAGSAVLSERLYLSGNFFVSAKGDNRAVLRPRGGDSNVPVRVIAEFPPGARLPDENEVISRDNSRAFEVREITKAADDTGTVNVYVREITRE